MFAIPDRYSTHIRTEKGMELYNFEIKLLEDIKYYLSLPYVDNSFLSFAHPDSTAFAAGDCVSIIHSNHDYNATHDTTTDTDE